MNVNERVGKLMELAKALSSSGKYFESLQIYLQLLHEDGPVAWFHYDIGCCYNELRNPNMARYHLSIAANEINDYKVAVQTVRAASLIGQTELVLSTFEANLSDTRFCQVAFPYLVSSADGSAILRFIIENLSRFEQVLSPHDRWLQFFTSNQGILNESLPELSAKRFSFSAIFPMCLLMTGGHCLQRVLTECGSPHLHFAATSWNLMAQLNNTSVKSYLNRTLPLWLLELIIKNDVDFVFDSSEEAPRINQAGINSWLQSVYGATDRAPDMLILTANSIVPPSFGRVSVAEINVYPVLAALSEPLSQTSGPSKGEITSFSLLNGVPRPHRCALMILLHRENLIGETSYSWWGQSNKKSMQDFTSYIQIMRDQLSSLSVGEDEVQWLRDLPPQTVDLGDAGSNTHFLCDSTPIKFLRSARIHVISETEFVLSGGTIRMTEKSVKPLVAGVPFVLVGVPLLIAHIREQGFDVLDDFIDHSYDNFSDHSQRLIGIVAEMKRLRDIEIPHDRLVQMASNNQTHLRQWALDKKEVYASRLSDWISCRRKQ